MYSEFAPAPTSHTLVVLSGGLDSSTALALAARNSRTIVTLSFDYGQRHARELESARALSKHYGALDHIEVSLAVPSDARLHHYEPGNLSGRELLPKSWKPGRNMLMLSYATTLAYNLAIPYVVTGIHADDTPGYPDCREKFLTAMEQAAQGALAYPVTLWTPFLRWNKVRIVRLGIMLDVPYEKTWTCYAGGAEPCHKCDACLRREAAFAHHGVVDPLCNRGPMSKRLR